QIARSRPLERDQAWLSSHPRRRNFTRRGPRPPLSHRARLEVRERRAKAASHHAKQIDGHWCLRHFANEEPGLPARVLVRPHSRGWGACFASLRAAWPRAWRSAAFSPRALRRGSAPALAGLSKALSDRHAPLRVAGRRHPRSPDARNPYSRTPRARTDPRAHRLAKRALARMVGRFSRRNLRRRGKL